MNPFSAPAFAVPSALEADRPPEERGVARDRVRLLLSTRTTDEDRNFSDLTDILQPGDLLVVNESATLPARLPARSRVGEYFLHLSTRYGPTLWVAEARWGAGTPGPLPLAVGDRIDTAGLSARWVAEFPGIPRLGFVEFDRDPFDAMAEFGRPIRYGYVPHDYPLDAYQTVFARVPGSAEMPSAARPFSETLVRSLRGRGVEFAALTLHPGVSSLEVGPDGGATDLVYPEPFRVPAATVEAVARARARGGRVIAVGTTVARALESATDSQGLHPAEGFTRLYISPERPPRIFDGLLTGFHTPTSSHLALLAAFAGAPMLERSYRAALERGYLWHEFGDSQLILRDRLPAGAF